LTAGIKAARAEEAERGHVKGLCFEEDLYGVVAEMGRQFGDETELVLGTAGSRIFFCSTNSLLTTPAGVSACRPSWILERRGPRGGKTCQRCHTTRFEHFACCECFESVV
jgi:hypothetical protein